VSLQPAHVIRRREWPVQGSFLATFGRVAVRMYLSWFPSILAFLTLNLPGYSQLVWSV